VEGWVELDTGKGGSGALATLRRWWWRRRGGGVGGGGGRGDGGRRRGKGEREERREERTGEHGRERAHRASEPHRTRLAHQQPAWLAPRRFESPPVSGGGVTGSSGRGRGSTRAVLAVRSALGEIRFVRSFVRSFVPSRAGAG
jgi:hypothetical protein